MPVEPRCLAAARVFAAATLLSFPLALSAQICTGNVSLKTQPMHLGVATSKRSPTTDYVADFSIGTAKGLFADASYIRPSIDTPPEISTSVNTGQLAVGYDVAVAKESPLHVCPLVDISLKVDNASFPGGSSSEHSVGYLIGGAAGWRAPVNDEVALIPSATLQFLSNHFTEHEAGFPDISGSVNAGQLNLALGVAIKDRVTLAPTLSVLFGTGATLGVAGVSAAVNFGR